MYMGKYLDALILEFSQKSKHSENNKNTLIFFDK